MYDQITLRSSNCPHFAVRRSSSRRRGWIGVVPDVQIERSEAGPYRNMFVPITIRCIGSHQWQANPQQTNVIQPVVGTQYLGPLPR